jgi:pimeloyl-ACP methyl ester carboxylesterase
MSYPLSLDASQGHSRCGVFPSRGVLQTLLILIALVALPAWAGKQSPPIPAIAWQSCGADFPGLECALVKVPLDYDAPTGAQTTIALARSPATDKKNRIGSLFVNPGGPGGSGVDLILSGFGGDLNGVLSGRFDIVGWDPRGIGASTPIRCWSGDDARDAYFGNSPIFPYLAAQEAPFFELNRKVADLCFGRDQPIIRHMSTADVVRDLDVLRQAVGDDKLNYLGYSYGSYVGNTYANLFPSKVRTLVIDGVLNPILWSSGWQIAADRTASFDVLKQFFKQCDLVTTTCSLFAPGGSAPQYYKVLNRLKQSPLVVQTTQGPLTFTYDGFVATTTSVMYSPEIWPLLADFVAALGQIIDSTSPAAAGVAATRAAEAVKTMAQMIRDARPSTRAEGDVNPYDNGTEAYLGNQCSDTQYPGSSLAVYSFIGRYAESGSFIGPFWWWGNAACATWPVSNDRYTGPWNARTSAPVLVVGNFFDPATDYAGAVASNLLLPNSRLLSYAGWGHTAAYSGRSTCVDDYVTSYFIEGRLPPAGTVCPASANPFTPPAAAARGSSRAMPRVGLPPINSIRPFGKQGKVGN